MYIYLKRDNSLHVMTAEQFWTWVKTGNLRRDDLLYAQSGMFSPATNFPELVPYLPPAPNDAVDWSGVFKVAAVVGIVTLILRAFEEPPRSKRPRSPNYEPLPQWKKSYVYERDRGKCTYCGVSVPRSQGHIDHSVSRINGGSNHLNNLRLACAPCNLSKGPLNSKQFSRWR
jgi:hypothetical protein